MEMIKATHWTIRGQLKLDQRVTVEGRDYYLRELKLCKDELGRASMMLTWEGCCDICGSKFNFKAPRSKFMPTASCRKHWGQA